MKEGHIMVMVHVRTKMSACEHRLRYAGMCTACGAQNLETTGFTVHHDVRELEVSREEASRIQDERKTSLLRMKRLSLVVDLDQTVIHCDTHTHDASLLMDTASFQLNGKTHYIKVRPGAREFLQRMTTLFEMHVYTAGIRAYAHEVVRILDPDRSLFGLRIVSREPSEKEGKFLSRIFPTDTSMVVILDDRVDVWENKDHVLPILPYHYFPEKHATDMQYFSQDFHALSLEKVQGWLVELHGAFFRESLTAVGPWIRERKSAILVGVRVFFSGIFPTDTTVATHPLGTLVLDLGGTLAESSTEATHLLTVPHKNTPNTQKAREKGGIHILAYQWLWACWANYERVDEYLYSFWY